MGRPLSLEFQVFVGTRMADGANDPSLSVCTNDGTTHHGNPQSHRRCIDAQEIAAARIRLATRPADLFGARGWIMNTAWGSSGS
jgi:hypothetical protein